MAPKKDALRVGLDQLNGSSPPAMFVSSYFTSFRHRCEGSEEYTAFPLELRVVTGWTATGKVKKEDRSVPYVLTYREGSCPGCGAVARSSKGVVTPRLDFAWPN